MIAHKINKGKGAAIKNAQKYTSGRYTGIQNTDLEYKPTDLLKILNYIKKKLNVVYGSRVLNKNKFKKNRSN